MRVHLRPYATPDRARETIPDRWAGRSCAAEPWLWDLHLDGEGDGDRRTRHQAAKAECLACPVLDLCTGMDHQGATGVIAGEVRYRKKVERSKAHRVSCGTPGGYWAHNRNGEAVCGPCRAAIARHSRERRLQAKP